MQNKLYQDQTVRPSFIDEVVDNKAGYISKKSEKQFCVSISKNFWFTLIEILVSLTILWIIIISIMSIFISSSDISMKSDINRSMQENIKSVFETISEDVRKNWINWVANVIPDVDCKDWSWSLWSFYFTWSKLCTWLNEYYLAEENIHWNFDRRLPSQCSTFTGNCVIVKNWIPLTNSFVSVKNLEFRNSDDSIPKVTILATFQPSVKKWVKSSLIKNNIINVETTISSRPF